MKPATLLPRDLPPKEKRQLLARLLTGEASGPKIRPVSFEQRRLWFVHQLEPESNVDTLVTALHLAGSLEVHAMERALEEIVRRHEVLRTTFTAIDGEPVQVVRPPSAWQLQLTELTVLGDAEREAELGRQLGAVGRPFDLEQGPLFRAHLLRLGGAEHVLLLAVHHLVSDGWSMGIFAHELSVLYEAYLQGRDSPLPELPAQYADYAILQRERLTGEVVEAELGYWRNQLASAPELLQLPADRPRPFRATHRGDLHRFSIPPALASRISRLAKAEGATPFMVLLAGFKVLLWRYSGQPDVVVGTALANRPERAFEPLIGFFLTTAPLRTELADELTFRDLLRRVRTVTVGAYAHQALPFEKLVEDLGVARSADHHPICQIFFTLLDAPRSGMRLPGLRMTALHTPHGTARFDLSLFLGQDANGLAGAFEYASDLFDGATVALMAEHYVTLLEAAVTGPERRIGELPLASGAEQRQVLKEWNATVADLPVSCIHRVFEGQAALTPDNPAVVAADWVMSYGELDRRANRLAHHLRRLGVGPDAVVGVCLDHSAALVVKLLAVLKAGGAYLPLDPEYPTERLQFMLADSRAKVLITGPELQRRIASASGPPAVVLDNPATEAILGMESEEALPGADAGPGTLAYVLYTSGSTGIPKGIGISHEAVVRTFYRTDYLQLTPADRVAQSSNISFDAAAFELWGPLLNGARLVIIDREVMLSPRDFAAQIQREGITVQFVTTALFNHLVSEMPAIFKPIRDVMFGGEAVDPRRVRDVLTHAPPKRLLHAYGPTETTTFATCYAVPDVAEGAITVPIGRPITNTTVYVLDRHFSPTPIGVAGELYIGGLRLARGYLNRPALTAERFLPDSFGATPGGRLYRTGDRVRLRRDGTLEFLGRMDGQVKLRGHRIEPGEIEAALRAHPVVGDACVIVREDRPGDKRLVAYCVWRPSNATTTSELRAWLRGRLPDYMVPNAFVSLASLPVTPNGKLDRRALPLPDAPGEETLGRVAPQTPVQEILVDIWAEVLQRERVGVEDDFFELGGHSLLAMRVVARVRAALGVELPIRTLFESPTPAGLAVQLGMLGSGPALPRVRPTDRAAALPLSFAQERLWFLDQLEPGSVAYVIPEAMRLRGPLDVKALGETLSELGRRHEVLRTTIVTEAGRPQQVIAPNLSLPLPVTELGSLTPAEQEREVSRRAATEAARPFDLARGPLLRVELLRLAAEEHVLLLTVHHIVADGWSVGVFLRELGALYGAYARDEPSPLAPLPVQYVDYARWQREQLQGPLLDQELAYWRRQLAGAPDRLELPTDRPRPSQPSHYGATVSFVLPASLTGRVKTLARSEQVTLFMALLAGFKLLLSRYSGAEEVVVGTVIAGRQTAELEDLIGCFINTLVLRTDFSGDPSFRTLLSRVRETTLGAYEHQNVPFEVVVDALQPERTLSYSPLFQAMFMLQNLPGDSFELSGLTHTAIASEVVSAKFDLTMSLLAGEDTIRGEVIYTTDLFDEATIQELVDHFQSILDAAVAEPDRPISQLSLLTSLDRQRVLIEWNATEALLDPVCVHRAFEAQVERSPRSGAVTYAGATVTYAELNRRAAALAGQLRDLSVGPDVVVGVQVGRSVELVVALLAVLKAGGAYLPLDPEYPPERLAFMLRDSGARVLISDRESISANPEVPAAIPVLLLEDSANRPSRLSVPPEVGPENLAYVIYTSGSTGTPKGVMISHRALANHMAWMQASFSYGPESVVIQKTPVSFDASVWEFFAPLLAGGRLVVGPPEGHRDTAVLATIIASEGVDTLQVVPTLLGALLADRRLAGCGTLRRVFCGGEALPVDLSTAFFSQSGAELWNLYGPTEATIDATSMKCRSDHSGSIVPIGRPVANTRCYVLDASGHPVPAGVPGELYIGGVQVARGYVHRPALTAERFVPDPFGPERGTRLYRTGDRVRWRLDGAVEFLGRVDEQIKLRGHRIEPGEIEVALRAHPDVAEAAVLTRLEQGDKRLVAYVVPAEPETTLAPEMLRGHLRTRLPASMVPTTFVTLQALPCGPNGKVDYRALPPPPADGNAPAKDRERVSTIIDHRVAQAMAEVLGAQFVGPDDDFFELGGHSLSAVRLMARVQQCFGWAPPLATLYRASTPRALGQVLADPSSRAGLQLSPLVPMQPNGSRIPLFCLHTVFPEVLCYEEIARHWDPDQPVYGIRDLRLDTPEKSNESVEQLASRYVEAISAIQPRGPYRLLGWSFGGVVAYEIARQFRSNGREVSLLALLDARGHYPGESFSREENIMWVVEGALGRLSPDFLERLRSLPLDEQVDYALAEVTRAGLPPLFKAALEIFRANTEAWVKYRPLSYDGDMVLLLATNTQWPDSRGPLPYWTPLVKGGITTHSLATDHNTIIAEPYAADVAEIVARYL